MSPPPDVPLPKMSLFDDAALYGLTRDDGGRGLRSISGRGSGMPGRHRGGTPDNLVSPRTEPSSPARDRRDVVEAGPRIVIRAPWLSHQPLRKSAAVALPFVLACAATLSSSQAPVGWHVSGPRTAADQQWMDSLVGLVVQTQTGSSPAPVDPNAAVVPVGGDPQNLTLAPPATPGQAQPTAPLDPAAAAQQGTVPQQVNLAAQPVAGETVVTSDLASSGIPVRALKAYVAAAAVTARLDPSCHLHWSLVAAIGRIESDHGRYGGARIATNGDVAPPIYGPRLVGGNGMAFVGDTDGGALDGDTVTDRAVGPMQFLPGTWRTFGSDANGDGRANPQNLDDAALSTARYLCFGDGDLATQADRWRAVLRYNNSASYAAHVLALADTYATGKVVPLTTPPPGVALPSATPTPSPSHSPSGTPSPSRSVSPSPSATGKPSGSGSPSPSPSSATPTAAPTTSTVAPTTTTNPPTTNPPTTTPPTTTPPNTTEPPNTTTTPPNTTQPPTTTTAPPTTTTPPTTTAPPTTTTTTSLAAATATSAPPTI